MNQALRLTLIVTSIILAAGLGFYIGLRQGSDMMSTLASENTVASALSRVDISLDALNTSDLATSQEQHQKSLKLALYELGSYAPFVPYWKCKKRDRDITYKLKMYIESQRNLKPLASEQILNQALSFCKS